MMLTEGGNVFATAEPFDHKDVPAILKTINNSLEGTGIRAIPVGSAATPKPGKKSGDMDVIVDEKAVLDFFKAKDAKTARKALSDYITGKGLETAQSGINVHVNVPVGNSHHQVDIMVAGNAERVAKFHTHDIPQGSPYKGVNKQLMLAILAKSKGYMWSAWQGLFARDENGKKADFVTDDLDEVAELLTGVRNSKVLGSVESILNALPSDEAAALLDRAKQDPNWKEIKQEDIYRLRKLAGLNEQAPPPMPNVQGLTPGQPKDLGNGERVTLKADGTVSYSGGFGEYIYDKTGKAIKYKSPNFAGLGKSTDLATNKTTTSYNAGPLNIKQGPDGEVDAAYDLGLGVAKMSKDVQGKTTGNYTYRTENTVASNPQQKLDQLMASAEQIAKEGGMKIVNFALVQDPAANTAGVRSSMSQQAQAMLTNTLAKAKAIATQHKITPSPDPQPIVNPNQITNKDFESVIPTKSLRKDPLKDSLNHMLRIAGLK